MRPTTTPRHAALLCGLTAGLLILLTGCDTGPGASIYDPDLSAAPDPVIESVEPGGSALAGIDVLTITGSNFVADTARTLVYFGSARGELLEASTTQLRVRPPNVPGDAPIRVVVLGAENFSNEVDYRLEPAVVSFGDLSSLEVPFGITSDADGNLYVSLVADRIPVGIKKITPEGERSDYFTSSFIWADLDFGPEPLLYGVRTVQAVFQLPEGGNQATWAVLPAGNPLVAITFDGQGNAWVGGNTQNLYRITPDQTIQPFPFVADVRDLVVYDGFLYAAARQEGMSKVWRFPLTSDGLGDAEVYFDVAQSVGANIGVFALAFAQNGDLFVGTNAPDPVILVTPDRNGAPLYPGIISSPVQAFAWGPGSSLYMVRGVTTPTPPALPEPPALFRLETRREGAR